MIDPIIESEEQEQDSWFRRLSPEAQFRVLLIAVVAVMAVLATCLINLNTWGKPVLIAGAIIAIFSMFYRWAVARERASLDYQHKYQHIEHAEHYRALTVKLADMGHSIQLKHVDHNGGVWELSSVSPMTIPNSPMSIENYYANGQEEQLQIAAPIAQPKLRDVIDELRTNELEVAYGMDTTTGNLVKSTLPNDVHLQLVGSSGFGKSVLASSIMTQATMRNSPDVLRIALLDLEDKTSKPFQHLPHVMEIKDNNRVIPLIALDADDVAAKLLLLVKLLNYRKERNMDRPLVLVYLEEFLALKLEVDDRTKDEMLRNLGILAMRGRKYGIFIMGLAQTGYMNPIERDAARQFRTKLACSMHPKAAQAAGFTNTPLLNEIYKDGRPGEFVIEKPGLSAKILATYEDEHFTVCRSILGSPAVVPNTIVTGSLSFPSGFPNADSYFPYANGKSIGPLDGNGSEVDLASLALIRKMVLEHKGVSEMASKVFPGRRTTDAIAEVKRYLAFIVHRAEV